LRFRFDAFEEEHFLEFLKQGLFDDLIEEVLAYFYHFSPRIQLELILYLRERFKDVLSPRVVSSALKIDYESSEKILRGEARVFPILLVEPSLSRPFKVKESRALVIPNTKKLITNLPEIKRKLQVVKKLTEKNFAVFFEDYFTGESFQLPLLVSLAVKTPPPKHLRFTGKVNSKGMILPVDHEAEKERYCKACPRESGEKGLTLISPAKVKNFETIKAYLERDCWDLPFYVTSSGQEEFNPFFSVFTETSFSACELEKESGGLSLLDGLELFYNLKKEDFLLITGKLSQKQDWEAFARAFYNKIQNLKNNLPGNKVFHLGMRGAVAFAFSLGILFSHFDPFVFYHYQTLEGRPGYHPIQVKSPRILKMRLNKYEYLKPYYEEQGDELVVIFNFSHHEPLADVKKYILERVEKPSFAVLETEYKGNLPVSAFLKVSAEAASYLQDLRRERSFTRFHFFFSCPVAIAFFVGLAFGHYADGVIYNFEKEESLYKPVLELKILREIREGLSEREPKGD